LSRTTEQGGRESVEAMIGEFKARMLAGDDKSRRLAKLGKSMSDRT
jgi:hypothetical protein